MRWLELTVAADVEAVEAVSEILGRVGGGSAVRPTQLLHDPDDELSVRDDPSAPYLVTAHIADDPSAPAALDATRRALWHLQAFGLRPVGELTVQQVTDDWTDAWRQHYVPNRIGRVVIVPSWLDEPLGASDVAVRMDPGMAFGTGLHPTTRACVLLLQQLGAMPDRVLDVGCGSGILALAALRLGAAQADGLDTDPLAVETSLRNAALNGLADRYTARVGSLPDPPAATYDLVLANLVAAVLVELAPRLAAHTRADGTLLASGIIQPREDEVRAALAHAGFALTSRAADGEWSTLRLRRANQSRA